MQVMTEPAAQVDAKRPVAEDSSGPLRAALLALGVGLVWFALRRGRRRRSFAVW
jgi:hypothetical protein